LVAGNMTDELLPFHAAYLDAEAPHLVAGNHGRYFVQ